MASGDSNKSKSLRRLIWLIIVPCAVLFLTSASLLLTARDMMDDRIEAQSASPEEDSGWPTSPPENATGSIVDAPTPDYGQLDCGSTFGCSPDVISDLTNGLGLNNELTGMQGRPPCGLCNQLEDARLTYNAPTEMTYGRETVIQLALLPKFVTAEPAAVLDDGVEGDRIIINDVEYSLRMRATLLGPAFDTSPQPAIDRTVLPTKVTKWTWTVVPKEYGTRNLTLELVAILMDGENELPPSEVRTFRRDIVIHVTPWDRAVIAAQSITAVHAAGVALGGTILSICWWIIARFRKPKPERPTVLEVILKDGNDEPPGGEGSAGV